MSKRLNILIDGRLKQRNDKNQDIEKEIILNKNFRLKRSF